MSLCLRYLSDARSRLVILASLAFVVFLSPISAQIADPVADKAIQRCISFGFTKGTIEFANCASEQSKLLSQSDAKVEEVPEKPVELNAALSTAGAQNIDEQARSEHSTQTPVSPIVDQATSAKTETLKFTGNVSFGRTATIVPTGDIEVDVQSNKGGAAAFGLLGAIVEAAATSEASQSDETVIRQYVTGSESDPRKRFAALLAEYLGSCFAETEAYTSVVQPLLGAKAWRLKDKRLDETRYEVVPSTNFIIEAKLTYSIVKTLIGTQLIVPIQISVFRQEDRKEAKRFSAVPDKLFGEFSALDGVSELESPTGDVLREGAMKLSNKICKAKL